MENGSTAFVLAGGLLIDGTGAHPYAGTLAVRDGRIQSIGEIPSGYEIIDVSGCTVLPGFVHAHAHPGYKFMGQTELDDYDVDWLMACLSAGITTVKDMGGLNVTGLQQILERRNRLNATGRYPRIVSAGKLLAAPGGYGGAAPVAASSVREARERAEWMLDAGADFIKTSLENGYSPDTALPKLSPEQLAAICGATRARGARVSAHLSQCEPLRVLVEAGITDAGHAPYEPMDDGLIRMMVERRVTMTPTLTLYRMFQEKYGAPFLGTAIENTRRFAKAGGVVAVGDDFIEPAEPWYRPGLPWGELELLLQAGLDNMQIIQALTANGAEACGILHETGTLVPGKRADVAVVRGNPAERLECLRDVEMVMVGGKIILKSG